MTAVRFRSAKEFTNALLVNNDFTRIDLSGNWLSAKDIKTMEKTLRENKFTFVDFGGNAIRDKGAETIAKLLHETSINSINLCWNGIGDSGAKALADGFRFKNSVTFITLWAHSCDTRGVKSSLTLKSESKAV